MKLKITDEKLDELAFEQSSHFTSYKKGFRDAEQMHQAKFDMAMQIIEMQRETLFNLSFLFTSVTNNAASIRIVETDKMMKELKE